jgi:hypothetical protein
MAVPDARVDLDVGLALGPDRAGDRRVHQRRRLSDGAGARSTGGLQAQLAIDAACLLVIDDPALTPQQDMNTSIACQSAPKSLACRTTLVAKERDSDPETKKDFENDVVIQLDGWLLLVEAKSGQVTASARRGSFDRIKREKNAPLPFGRAALR